jgi:hypothetical protein
MLFLLLACATDDGARTLENCETSIADEVPLFYQDFYRCADIALAGDEIAITTIDLPPHASPYYPPDDPNWVAFDERGGTHFQNPNEIAEQSMTVTVPVEPVAKGITVTAELVDLTAGTSDDEYPGGNGVQIDGTLLFAAMAAPGDDITEEEYTFDTWEGHPQNTGIYHHHGPNPAGLAALVALGFATTDTPGEAELEVYGIMCDGTVILGCTEMDGSAPAGTFDAQGGHVHDLVGEDGTTYFSDRYHTHMCEPLTGHGYTPEIQYYEGCARTGP